MMSQTSLPSIDRRMPPTYYHVILLPRVPPIQVEATSRLVTVVEEDTNGMTDLVLDFDRSVQVTLGATEVVSHRGSTIPDLALRPGVFRYEGHLVVEPYSSATLQGYKSNVHLLP